MLITFLRHAQSEANIRWALPTRDTTLTPLGVQQSENLKGHYDVVYCSPMRRARDTLSKSQITYDELVIAHEVRECVYSVDDIIHDEDVSNDFIETDADIIERCRKFHRMLLTKNKECNLKILVLSHYGFISDFSFHFCSHRVGLDVACMKEQEVKTFHADKRSERRSHRFDSKIFGSGSLYLPSESKNVSQSDSKSCPTTDHSKSESKSRSARKSIKSDSKKKHKHHSHED